MMTLATDNGTVVINARWWPQGNYMVAVTQDNLDEFLRTMYVGLRDSDYNAECFSLSDVEFRMAVARQMSTIVEAFMDAGYNPRYISRRFRELSGRRRGHYGIENRSDLKPQPDADFGLAVNVPLYPLFAEWAQRRPVARESV
ncbi:MAG: hypothetical protein M1272_07835 [Firmicutes bacterium]|nr:hypothetical protein [Bacillota bacterium]